MTDLLSIAPSFMITQPPSTTFNEKLVSDLLLQDMHNRGGSRCGNRAFTGLVQGGVSANAVCLVNLAMTITDILSRLGFA